MRGVAMMTPSTSGVTLSPFSRNRYYTTEILPNTMKKLITFGAALFICGAMVAQKNFTDATPVERSGAEEQSLAMNLYPNPNNGGVLNIEVSGLNLDTQSSIDFSIVDRTGHARLRQRYTVQELTSFTNRIDLAKVPPGIYTVRLVAGNATINQRLAIGN